MYFRITGEVKFSSKQDAIEEYIHCTRVLENIQNYENLNVKFSFTEGKYTCEIVEDYEFNSVKVEILSELKDRIFNLDSLKKTIKEQMILLHKFILEREWISRKVYLNKEEFDKISLLMPDIQVFLETED